MKREPIFLLFSALVVILVAACNPQPNEVPITIGGPPNVAILAQVAAAEGYFSDENLSVEVEQIQTGKQTQDAVIAGQLDYGVVLDVNIAYLALNKTSVRALAVITTKNDDGLIARRDRQIAGPSDLVGKRIAALPGTTSAVYLDRLLAQAGVTRDEVTLITMPPPAMQAAVVRGEVDAASVWEPFRQNAAMALGTNALDISAGPIYKAKVLVIADHPNAAVQRSEEVRLLRALRRAAVFARNNPARAQEIASPSLGLPRNAVAQLWRYYEFDFESPVTAIQEVERIQEWIRRTQPDFAKQTATYTKNVLGDSSFVEAAQRK